MNKNAVSTVNVGFMPVMAKLYERLIPDLKADLGRNSQEICSELSGEALTVHSSDVVCTDREIRKAIAKFEQMDVDLLVVGHVTYCPSGQILPGLLKTSLPILLWPAQTMLELVGSQYDTQTVILNHGVHGTQDLANVLGRNGKAFGLLHGHQRQNGFKETFLEWACAGKAVVSMRKSHPLMLGGHFDSMLDLQLEGEPFLKRFGVTGCEISSDEFVKVVKTVSNSEVQKICDDYRSLFKIDGNVTKELLEKTARYESAVRKVMKKYDSRAIGINFLSLCNDGRIADGLHVAASRFMAEGLGYGGEGDWVTAMMVHGLEAATQNASFSEIFSVGYQDNRLVLRHWGEGNYALARSKPVLRRSQFTDEKKAEFAVLDFEFKAGGATLVNLNATPEGKGQIITMRGKIDKERLSAVDGPRGIFRPERSDVRELLNDYDYRGGSHHLALVLENREELVSKIARLTGWNCVRM